MGSYPSSKKVGDVLLIKVKISERRGKMGNQHAMDLFEEEKKVYKSASSSYHFPQRRKPLFRCQYESH